VSLAAWSLSGVSVSWFLGQFISRRNLGENKDIVAVHQRSFKSLSSLGLLGVVASDCSVCWSFV